LPEARDETCESAEHGPGGCSADIGTNGAKAVCELAADESKQGVAHEERAERQPELRRGQRETVLNVRWAWFKKLGFRVTAKIDKVAPAKGFRVSRVTLF
jgi:hypothetical protein